MVQVWNFGHPTTDDQRKQINKEMSNQGYYAEIVDIRVQLDPNMPLTEQITAIMKSLKWQNATDFGAVIILPELAAAAVLILLMFHGRQGYFPQIMTWKEVAGEIPSKLVIDEVIFLQRIQENSRHL